MFSGWANTADLKQRVQVLCGRMRSGGGNVSKQFTPSNPAKFRRSHLIAALAYLR